MMSVNLNYISILNIQGADYRFSINVISKSDAVNLLHNAEVTEKWKIIKYEFFDCI